MIDIEDVKKLNIGPDDILVLQVKGNIPGEVATKIRDHFVRGFPALKNKIMVLDENISLAVLVAEEAKLRAEAA